MSTSRHAAVRAKLARHDAITAKKPGVAGAAARFRQQHGNLCDFLMTEGARDDDEEATAMAAAGYGPNFQAAIVQCAINSASPIHNAKCILKWLSDGVMRDLKRLQSGDLVGDYVEVTVGSGEIHDYDVLHDLKPGSKP